MPDSMKRLMEEEKLKEEMRKRLFQQSGGPPVVNGVRGTDLGQEFEDELRARMGRPRNAPGPAPAAAAPTYDLGPAARAMPTDRMTAPPPFDEPQGALPPESPDLRDKIKGFFVDQNQPLPERPVDPMVAPPRPGGGPMAQARPPGAMPAAETVPEEEDDPIMADLKASLAPRFRTKQIDKQRELDELSKPTEMEDRDKRLKDLEMYRGISQGGQTIANAFRDYATSPRMGPMHGIDREEARVRERIPAEIRAQLEKSGINMPEGSNYQELGAVSAAQQRADTSARMREKAAFAKEVQERKDTLKREENQRKEAKLSDVDLKTVSGFDTMIELLESIKRDKPQFDTGPVAGRFHTAAGVVGMDDPKKAAFKSQVVTQFNDQLRQQTGTAVSPGEVARLQAAMPTMNDNDEVFTSKLESVQKQLKTKRDVWLVNKKRQGKDISEFTGGPASGGENKVRVQSPDGKVGFLPVEEYKKSVGSGEFDRDGWKKL